MNEDKFMSIYVQLKENSIGPEKKCKYNKKTVGTILKSSVLSLTALLCCSGIVGCKKHSMNQKPTNNVDVTKNELSETEKSTKYNYTEREIKLYEKTRTLKLLESNNMNEYTFNEKTMRREYAYTATDYLKIIELDDTYLLGFYNLADTYTVTEVCKALGYENLNSYLISTGYNNNGNPDKISWLVDSLDDISKMMYAEENENVGVK